MIFKTITYILKYKLFLYKIYTTTPINIKHINYFNYIQKKNIDNYNILYFALNGILIWLNILHINVILIKFTFLILLNNLEYLILIKSIL